MPDRLHRCPRHARQHVLHRLPNDGGFELDHFDPARGEHDTTTEADPNALAIADEILTKTNRQKTLETNH